MLLLVGCATSPMTQGDCEDMGGDQAILFKENGWKCCKIVRIDNKTYCQEVEHEKHFIHFKD